MEEQSRTDVCRVISNAFANHLKVRLTRREGGNTFEGYVSNLNDTHITNVKWFIVKRPGKWEQPARTHISKISAAVIVA